MRKDSQIRLIIGTSAFGMGVDCPDIRQIYHWGPLEEYAQKVGRGGRDQTPSKAILTNVYTIIQVAKPVKICKIMGRTLLIAKDNCCVVLFYSMNKAL